MGQNFLDVPSKRIQYVARDLPPKPIAEAPAPVRHMIEKLQQLAGRTVNYASLVIYENENDHMGWHQHKEDKGHDTPVFIVPVGAERTFGIREKGNPETTLTFTAKSGSLITLPSEYNDTHEHAVLKDKGPEPRGGLFMEPPISEAEYMAITPEQRMEYDDARIQQLAELRVPKDQHVGASSSPRAGGR